jgi:hypothetical protein
MKINDCINWSTREKTYLLSPYGGTEIIFDSRKSKSGKSILIDASSRLPHQCKYSNFAKQQQQVTPKEEKEVKREPTITELLNGVLFNIHELQKEIQELRK